MVNNFYDKVAKKFGGYGYGASPKYTSEYPAGEPEKIFKENIYPKGLAPSPVLKDFRKELFLEKNSFQFSLKIKGLIGPSGEFLIKQETAYNYIVVESDNNKYFILIYPDDAEFNQILSTFKFTK